MQVVVGRYGVVLTSYAKKTNAKNTSTGLKKHIFLKYPHYPSSAPSLLKLYLRNHNKE